MNCSQQNLRNLNTTVYRTDRCGCGCDDNNLTIQFIDRPMPCYPFYPGRPPFAPGMPPVTPPVTPPVITPPSTAPTASYAQFVNSAATGQSYTAGTAIPFPLAVYNTDAAGIVNNNGVISLAGGATGRSYLINYQLTGTFTDAAVGLVINGANDRNTNAVFTGSDEATVSGSYIVTVPANSVSTVSLNVIEGTVQTATPTTATNLSVVRIA